MCFAVCIVIVDISKNQLSGIFTLFSCAYPQYVEFGGAVVRAPALESQGSILTGSPRYRPWASCLPKVSFVSLSRENCLVAPVYKAPGALDGSGVLRSDDSKGSYCKAPLKSTHTSKQRYNK